MDSSVRTSKHSQNSSKDHLDAAISKTTGEGDHDRHGDETTEKKNVSFEFPSMGIVFVILMSWALYHASGQSLLAFASKVMLLLLTILFMWSKAARALNRPMPRLPKMNISEETINRASILACEYLNKILLGFENIALGKDSRLFYIVAFGLWLASVIGSYAQYIDFGYIRSLMTR